MKTAKDILDILQLRAFTAHRGRHLCASALKSMNREKYQAKLHNPENTPPSPSPGPVQTKQDHFEFSGDNVPLHAAWTITGRSFIFPALSHLLLTNNI